MLKIINNLKEFFEDSYQEISVRQYARIKNISPPKASKMLKDFEEKGLLKKREDRNHLLFRVNRESNLMKSLSRIYWEYQLEEAINKLKERSEAIILFGSISKLEVNKNSDIDLAITGSSESENLTQIEKKLKRKIQIFSFKSFKEIPKKLKNQIINGEIIYGRISI